MLITEIENLGPRRPCKQNFHCFTNMLCKTPIPLFCQFSTIPPPLSLWQPPNYVSMDLCIPDTTFK